MGRERSPTRWLHRLGIGGVPPDESVTWEIEHHLAELVDRLIDEGWRQEDAMAEAQRRFGDRRRYGPSMERLERVSAARKRATEVLYFLQQVAGGALRTARRYPGFTAGVVITLGLGIGANSTMYGIIDRLLLSPPRYIDQPDQVRRVIVQRPSGLTGRIVRQAALTYPDYEDLEAHEGLSVAAYDYVDELTIGTGDLVTPVRGALVSAKFLPLLGVTPVLGRLFTEEETANDAQLTAILSEEYWRQAYGSDPDVLGRTIQIRDYSATIIGVLPAGFTGVDLRSVDLWLPLEATRTREEGASNCMRSRGCYWMGAVARLNDGVSVIQAEEEATRLHLNGRRDQVEAGRYPDVARIVLAPLVAASGPDPSSEARVAKWLTGVAAIVFLIACANVANILLARGAQRRREMAVRLALGVNRTRLVGQLTLEAVLLALAGGVLALAIARWGGGLVRQVLLPGVYFPDAALNARVLTFTLVASLLAGLLAGVGPALQGSRMDLARHFADGRGGAPARTRLRGTLTVVQAAMSVVLLVGAGLFIRSLTALRGQDLGLDVDRLLVVDFEFTRGGSDVAERNEAYTQAIARLSTLPDVESAAGTGSPLGYTFAITLHVPGLDSLPRLPGGGPYVFSIGPRYFETTGLRILSGRSIGETDGEDSEKVAVVSELMARALWPEEEPLGQCLLIGPQAAECTRVVGVVESAARNGYLDEDFMAYYVPMKQAPDSQLRAPNGLYVRARGDVADAREGVAAALRSFSPLVRWVRVIRLEDTLNTQARAWTLGATMFTVFGLLALVLAAIGLYGVLAFEVAQRTRELGVRSALGAQRGGLLRSVLYRGLGMGALGIAAGLAIAYLAAPYTRDLLFQVSPRDPWVLGGVALTLLAVSALASLVPGLRATHIDPVTALKSE